METIKVGDYVTVISDELKEYVGKVVNISDYRPPEMKYAVDIKGLDDYVFVGDNHIKSEITNRDWLNILTNKQLATFLCSDMFTNLKMSYTSSLCGLEDWLGQPHNSEYDKYYLMGE